MRSNSYWYNISLTSFSVWMQDVIKTTQAHQENKKVPKQYIISLICVKSSCHSNVFKVIIEKLKDRILLKAQYNLRIVW